MRFEELAIPGRPGRASSPGNGRMSGAGQGSVKEEQLYQKPIDKIGVYMRCFVFRDYLTKI